MLSSSAHYWLTGPAINLDKELPPRAQNFSVPHAYAFSNLCAFARGLSKRVPYPVISLHPAAAPSTGMGNGLSAYDMFGMIPKMLCHELRGVLENQTIAMGARTQTFCIVAPREMVEKLSGKYLSGNETDGPLGEPVEPSLIAQREDYCDKVMEFIDAYMAKERV